MMMELADLMMKMIYVFVVAAFAFAASLVVVLEQQISENRGISQ